MSFIGYEFIFDGVPCTKYDLMLYDIGSNKQGDTVSFPSAGKPIEDRISRRPTSLLYNTEKNQPLSFPLVFGASPDRTERNASFDRFEIEAISSWLTGHSTWKWLKISQPDLEGMRYKCLITELKQISYGKYPWAFSCTVTCDSPYGYRSTNVIEFRCDRISTLSDLLTAAYFVYGDASDPTALDGLDMDKVSNAPMWLRADTDGNPFATEAAVKAALQQLISKVMPQGFNASNINTLTWLQAQYMMLGNGYKTDAILATDASINYWWLNGGSKPTGENPDALAIQLLNLVSRLDPNVADPSEADVVEAELTALLDQYAAGLMLQGPGGTPYSTAAALRAELVRLVDEVYWSWDPDFMDSEMGLYAEMTWNEVQHYLITGTFTTEESGTIPAYSWKPTLVPSATDLDVLTATMVAYLDGNANAIIDMVTLDGLKSTWKFKRTKAGGAYTITYVNAARNNMALFADAAKPVYYDTDKKILKVDWYQIQYALINAGALETPTNAKAWLAANAPKIVPPSWADLSTWPEFATLALPLEELPVELAAELTPEEPVVPALPRSSTGVQITKLIFRNRSSYNDIYYPTIEIDLRGATEIEIVNHSNRDSSFKFTNIPPSVKKIVVDNENGVITADNGLNIYKCFNFGFLGLVRGDNKLSVKGKCVLRFICDFPVNVGG